MKKGWLRKIRRERMRMESQEWDLIVHDGKRPIEDDDEPVTRRRKRRCRRWEKRRITALLEEHGGKLLAELFQPYYKEKFGFGDPSEFDISYFDSFSNFVKIKTNAKGKSEVHLLSKRPRKRKGKAEVHLLAKRPRTEGGEVVEQIALDNLKRSETQASTETRDQFFERIKENIVKLLCEYGGKLPLDKFNPFYQIKFGEKLDIRKFGISRWKRLGRIFRRDLADIVEVDPANKLVYLLSSSHTQAENLYLSIDNLKERAVQMLEKNNGKINLTKFRPLYYEIFNEEFDFKNFEGLRHFSTLSKFFMHHCKDIIDVVRKGETNGAGYIRLKNEKTNEVFETRTESQSKVPATDSSEHQRSSASATTTSPAAQRQRLSSVSDTQAENFSWSVDILKQRTVHILEKNDGEIVVSQFKSLYSQIFNEEFDFKNFEGLRHLDSLSNFLMHYCKDIIDVVRTEKRNCVMRLKNKKINEVLETRTEYQGKMCVANSSEQQVSSASFMKTPPAAQRQGPSSVNSTTVSSACHHYQLRQSSLELQNPPSRKEAQRGPASTVSSSASKEQKQTYFPTVKLKQPTEALQGKMFADFDDNGTNAKFE